MEATTQTAAGLRLADLEVVFFDAQATAANLESGHLLEIAWATGSASEPPHEVVSYRVALPDGATIPRRVSRITGITEEDLEGVPTLDDVSHALKEAWQVADTPFALAHYARYEKAFVDTLVPDEERRWICTHAIAKRALAGLPRKGLRAVAGYLGDPMHEVKRASEHVRATIFIWQELLAELEGEGIETLDELEAYLEKPATRRERIFPLERETRLALPQKPGVYRMKGRDGTVLYVGKATNLKSRVNSYYRGKRGQGSNKLELVSQVFEFDITETATPLEAALLEADQIKEFAPAYNSALRRRDRHVFWASSTLDSTSPTCDETHVIGPIASSRLWQSIAHLPQILRGDLPSDDWLGDINYDVMREGIELFRERHGDDHDFDSLRELGESIFFERKSEDVDEEGDDEEDAEVESEWTPDGFAEYLEWQAIGLHRRSLRGEWLSRLANSWVAYVHSDSHRLLRFEDGELIDASDAGTREAREAVVDLGSIESLSLRAYDRLNVLLTELRKLVRDDFGVRIVSNRVWEFDELRVEFSRF